MALGLRPAAADHDSYPDGGIENGGPMRMGKGEKISGGNNRGGGF